MRYQCHKNFCKFASNLLDDKQAAKVIPSFSLDQATEYFQKTYQSAPKSFEKQVWMSTPTPPTVELDTDPIQELEVTKVVKNSKSTISFSRNSIHFFLP